MASLTFKASAPSSFNQQEGKEKEEDHIEDFHKLRLEMASIGLATFQGAEFGHLTMHTQGKPRTLSPSFSGCTGYFGCHTLKALVILKAQLHSHTRLTQDQLVMQLHLFILKTASQMTNILGLH